MQCLLFFIIVFHVVILLLAVVRANSFGMPGWAWQLQSAVPGDFWGSALATATALRMLPVQMLMANGVFPKKRGSRCGFC